MVSEYPLDRSAAFTALLELAPAAFGRQELRQASATITRFLAAYRDQPLYHYKAKPCACEWTCCPHCPHWDKGEQHPRPQPDMFEFARRWIAQGGLDEGETDATGPSD